MLMPAARGSSWRWPPTMACWRLTGNPSAHRNGRARPICDRSERAVAPEAADRSALPPLGSPELDEAGRALGQQAEAETRVAAPGGLEPEVGALGDREL